MPRFETQRWAEVVGRMLIAGSRHLQAVLNACGEHYGRHRVGELHETLRRYR
jgi:hypothetical protein